MESIVQTIGDVDWKVAVLSFLCGAQLYKSIKDTFCVKWRDPQNVLVKGSSREPVTLYVFQGSGVTVSSSPFSCKLETYCRLAGIPHTIKEADFNKAPKDKVPYIQHGDNILGDSQLIIRYLENTFDVKQTSARVRETNERFIPFDELSSADQAKSDMIRALCEQDIYWGVVSSRWGGKRGICATETAWHNTVESYFEAIPAVMRGAITNLIRVQVLRDAWGQGLCRHSPDDQIYLQKRSLKALSVTLGSQKFMLGDHPTECDCIAFGTVDVVLDDSKWPNKLTDFVRESCPNLVTYHSHMRKSVFSDFTTGQRLPAGVN